MVGSWILVMGVPKHSMKEFLKLFLGSLLWVGAGFGKVVPAQLPKPDGQPGNMDRPVQVYLLAGQSNMVGMGDLRGARSLYDGIFYVSDHSIPKGPISIYRVGNYVVDHLQVKGVKTGEFVAPQKGVYKVHLGLGGAAIGAIKVDGREVYRREKGGKAVYQFVELEAGQKLGFEIQSDQQDGRFWIQKTDMMGNGDLESVVMRDGMFPWLLDGEKKWSVRKDVFFQEARIARDGRGSHLSATSNGRSIGPELGFGHVLGEFHDEQVLLIKTAMGNRSLGFDFRPPSSGRKDLNNKFESLEYRLMVDGIKKTLAKIEKVVPGYRGQGYELAGFVWFQGHKDGGSPEGVAEYEKHLVHLIQDVRKEFQVPQLPVAVATIGFDGEKMGENYLGILKAQMAVGDPKVHPQFSGSVVSVDTRPFWREVVESPKNEGYHYHRNAETYYRVGDALGRAMVGLKGGVAETLPQGVRLKSVVATLGPNATEQQKVAAKKAVAPIVLDGIIPSYVDHPRWTEVLRGEAAGSRPKRSSQFLRGATYGLVNCYREAGVSEYDWKVFGRDWRDQEWSYLSFDPSEKSQKPAGQKFRVIKFPQGAENWMAPDFDAVRLGWKRGLPPFGQKGGELVPLRTCSRVIGGCGCGEKPRTLWEKEVIAIRGTFQIPKLKENHRYRLVVGGSNHVFAGEGFEIFVNGKSFAKSAHGVSRRQGGQPRGGMVFEDVRAEFDSGEVTVAVYSFLRENRGVKEGHLTVWMEEQKLPQVLLDLVKK